MRDESPRWPSPVPIGNLLVIGLSLGSLYYGIQQWRQAATPLQAIYIYDYARASLVDPLPLARFDLVINRNNQMAVPSDTGELHIRQGRVKDKSAYASWLREEVYDGHSLFYILRIQLAIAGFILVVGMLIFSRIHAIANHDARAGKLIRGPRVLSRWATWRGSLGRKKGMYIDTR